MRENINTWLDQFFNLGLLAVIILIPFFFWNLTTDFYDTPKFLILTVFCGLMLLLTALKYVTEGKVTIIRTPLDVGLILLLTAAIISTFISPARWVSIFGNNQLGTGLAAYVLYIIFFYLLATNLRYVKDVKKIINLLQGVGILLGIWALLSYFGLHLLPLDWTHAANFTPTGSSFSSAAFLALILPFPLLSAIKGEEPSFKFFNGLLAGFFGVVIVLTGVTATYVAGAAALALVLLIHQPSYVAKNIGYLVIPAVLVAAVAVLSFAPFAKNNPLYSTAQNFPREVQLSFPISWKISASAFRDSPFFGSGPGTYLFDFTAYKPIEFNSTNFWNLRFSQAFDEYLGMLGVLGGLGLIALLLLTAAFLTQAYKNISSRADNSTPEKTVGTSLAVSGIIFFVLLTFHSASLVVWVIGLTILASFLAVHKDAVKVLHLKIAAIQSASDLQLRYDLLPGVFFLIIIVVVIAAFVFLGKFTMADFNHRQAITAVQNQNGLLAYNKLVAAENLNPNNDLYRTDLAQTNLALANSIAASAKPTESSPSGTLSEQDKQNIQQLLSQSVAEGRAAVSLSPRNVGNFEILGNIYRQINGVAQNALTYSLDSYGRAIALDPLNPLLRLTVGGIYYADKNYDMAVRFFTDAINLKPDFANGYYNLSIALRDKGDLKGAQAAAEQMVSLLDQASPDYKMASDYLADLKNRIATGSASESQVAPPAATENAPLQQKELPQVLNLPKPENVATPPAVEKK